MCVEMIVIFRVWKNYYVEKFPTIVDVIAIFPGIPGGAFYGCMSWMVSDGFGDCNPHALIGSVYNPVTYPCPAHLAIEMQTILEEQYGYKLKVRKKLMSAYMHWNKK